jgi:hypothetical protein
MSPFVNTRYIGGFLGLGPRFAGDSLLEEGGFELSVPRDTTEVSRLPYVASA